MLPDPLHPAVVHFPIVLMLALPAVVWFASKAHRNGRELGGAWKPVVVVAFALAAVSWFALETGASDGEAVEAVVGEALVKTHAVAAAVFMALAGVVALLSLAGLMKERAGEMARYATAVGAVLLVAVGIRVGHTGGELVYDHGAAAAYVVGGDVPITEGPSTRTDDHDGERGGKGEDDDDEQGGR